MAALRLKPVTAYAVFVCTTIIIVFTQAPQVVECSYTAAPGGTTRKLLLQQQQVMFVTAAGRETRAEVKQAKQVQDGAKGLTRGSMTPRVDGELRTVPSGPDPLHHHSVVPKRPETP